MNKRGALFATLTILIMIVFVISLSMRKTDILKENKIIEAGDAAESIISFSLNQEETEFFIEKAIEISTFKSLNDLGTGGGFFIKDSSCGLVDDYTLFKDGCNLPNQIQNEFLGFFSYNLDNILFQKNLKEFGKDWNLDENGDTHLEVNGNVILTDKGIAYDFNHDVDFEIDYDFGNFRDIFNFAYQCVENERNKGPSQNLLFEDCRNDSEFEWIIKEKDGNVFFDVTTKEKYENFGFITMKFAIPLNPQIVV